MDVFLENAQRIFDVARSDNGAESNDFAVLIRPDGGLHFVMESPVSLEAAAVHGGARTTYHVTKTSGGGVRVAGRSGNQECLLEQHPSENHGHRVSLQSPASRFTAELLRDQLQLYWISSPLTISTGS